MGPEAHRNPCLRDIEEALLTAAQAALVSCAIIGLVLFRACEGVEFTRLIGHLDEVGRISKWKLKFTIGRTLA